MYECVGIHECVCVLGCDCRMFVPTILKRFCLLDKYMSLRDTGMRDFACLHKVSHSRLLVALFQECRNLLLGVGGDWHKGVAVACSTSLSISSPLCFTFLSILCQLLLLLLLILYITMRAAQICFGFRLWIALSCKVPSAYLLTDAFLLLDKRMEKKLFRPSRELNETRMGLAAVEAVKAKRLLGALRSLWRSSPWHGQDTRITHLKSYLMQSPNRRAGRAALPDAGEAPAAAAAPAAEQDEESEGDESRGDENGGDERGGDESGGDESEGGEKEGDESGDSEVEMLGPSAPTSPGDGARDDSSSDVYAPTLRLDDCRDPSPPYQMVEACSSESDSSDGESPKDSQVPGAGWMGKAMMNARHLEREEAEQAELEQRLGHLLGVIQESLERQLGNEHTLDGTLWHQYEKWCYEAMKDHGEQAFDKLSQLEFFQRWVREQKATPAEDCPFSFCTVSFHCCNFSPFCDKASNHPQIWWNREQGDRCV